MVLVIILIAIIIALFFVLPGLDPTTNTYH
jgi:hypothetical protein